MNINSIRKARCERMHAESGDQRSAFQRDRDRVLYSAAFRRLAGVTQVVGPSEGHVFHNRLTHTIKVAQVSRRIAEKLRASADSRKYELALLIEPDVVEAAALIHDLGHPSFGHVGENELNLLVGHYSGGQQNDGFEGNAQSFRIITALEAHRRSIRGVNLTRATLNASLKYPWLRESSGERSAKWGAYQVDRDAFEWARSGAAPTGTDGITIEAEIMDWADDITYSLHDVEDFYRAGMLPLNLLIINREERERFAVDVAEYNPGLTRDRVRLVLDRLVQFAPAELRVRYDGRQRQRGALNWFISHFVGRYVKETGVDLDDGGVPVLSVDPKLRDEVAVLTELTRHYVYGHRTLAAQQHGERRILRDLFDILMEALRGGNCHPILTPRHCDWYLQAREDAGGEISTAGIARVVSDVISSLTEQEAVELHHRLTGIHLDRISHAIVR